MGTRTFYPEFHLIVAGIVGKHRWHELGRIPAIIKWVSSVVQGLVLRPLTVYLSGVGLSSVAMGIQIVLLPWLVVGVLGGDGQQVGWVQAAVLIPGLLLTLWGGALADTSDGRQRLPQLLMLLAVIHGLMSLVVAGQQLVLPLLLAYGVLLGVAQAFMQPLRDSLLPRVVRPGDGADLQRTIVKISLSYFVFQAAGIYLAGQLENTGAALLLGLQGLAVLLAAASYWRLPVPTEPVAAASRSTAAGVSTVMQTPLLRQMMVLAAFNGFMHMGVFIVAMPLLVRDVFEQGAGYFASLQLAFVGGNVAANLGLLRRKVVDYPARGVLFCVFYTGLILLAIGARPTTTGLLMLVFGWGVVTGVSSSLGKSVVQQLAPDAQRGRVMSIYQLALFGTAPLGALACGYAVDSWGTLTVLQVSGGASVLLFLVTLLVPGLWQLRQRALQADSVSDSAQ